MSWKSPGPICWTGANPCFLEIPLLTPCHQVHLHLSTVEDRYQDLYATAHVLAPPFADFPGYQAAPKRYLEADRSQTEVAAKPNPWATGAPDERWK